MRTMAVAAIETEKFLEIIEVELDGSQTGEALIEIYATGTVAVTNPAEAEID
ncbi:hypothetical protein [Ruegeria faecimaris]|uniref:Uncharacterized protein n=1 Tax=Ruegeria faecimaris TaxID=686389 RepID=A0A521CJS3_9RHOB|nr:hypothetical protein [Ruegeria faecimaris]SMO59713.1 hypothetical protein SAMN06265380_10354 [Ruegeria faecimaris]